MKPAERTVELSPRVKRVFLRAFFSEKSDEAQGETGNVRFGDVSEIRLTEELVASDFKTLSP